MQNSPNAFHFRMCCKIVEVRLESFFLGPSGRNDAGDAVASVVRQGQDVQGFIHHLRFIHVALHKNALIDFKSVGGVAIVSYSE